MLILHSKHSAESNAFIGTHGEGHTIIDWYDNPEVQLQYLLSGLPQPNDFPFVVYEGKGFVNPESPQWVKDEVEGKHLTDQQKLDQFINIKKLDIRRAMRSLGNEASLDAILQNEQFKKDWDDAGTEVNFEDDLLQMALSQMGVDADEVKREILGLN